MSKLLTLVVVDLALGLSLLQCAASPAPVAPVAAVASASPAKRYVCPACGSTCDTAVYDHPGACPMCGMPLVEESERSAAAAKVATKTVAVLIFDGAEIIDFTGPWEVFGAADYDVYTVAATKEPITTAMGMKVAPSYTFADAPVPSVLLVPGGGVRGARSSAATLAWVKQTSDRAEVTLSVCNGAFILASAGLLDGLSATTTAHLLGQLASEFPKTKVMRDRRYVDNGRIVTAGGLSSGIDGALHVVEKMRGHGRAQATALGVEYDWHPEAPFTRAMLADRWIPDVDIDALGTWDFDKTEGTADRWEIVLHGTSPKSAGELMESVGKALTKGKWRSVASTATTSDWRFEDDQQKPWTGSLAIEPPAAGKREYVVRVKIARAQ
jgi:putative intracellular protease/amidase